jgi:hypothetical protein
MSENILNAEKEFFNCAEMRCAEISGNRVEVPMYRTGVSNQVLSNCQAFDNNSKQLFTSKISRSSHISNGHFENLHWVQSF